MSEKTITLYHPLKGEAKFPEAQARGIMAMANNGGWEWKNKEDAARPDANKGNNRKAKKQDKDTGGDTA